MVAAPALDHALVGCYALGSCEGRAGATKVPRRPRSSASPSCSPRIWHRGRWLLQSAIAEVAHQAKSRALAAVVLRPEIRHQQRPTPSRRHWLGLEDPPRRLPPPPSSGPHRTGRTAPPRRRPCKEPISGGSRPPASLRSAAKDRTELIKQRTGQKTLQRSRFRPDRDTHKRPYCLSAAQSRSPAAPCWQEKTPRLRGFLAGRTVQIGFAKPFLALLRPFCGHPDQPDTGHPRRSLGLHSVGTAHERPWFDAERASQAEKSLVVEGAHGGASLNSAKASEGDAAHGVGDFALAEASFLAHFADCASDFRPFPRVRAARVVVHSGLLALGAGDQSRAGRRSQEAT